MLVPSGVNSTTLIDTANSNGSTAGSAAFYLGTTTTGSVNVSCSWSTGNDFQYVVESLTGANTATPLDLGSVQVDNNDNSSNPVISSTIAATGEWVASATQGNSSPTSVTNMTERSGGFAHAWDSNGSVSSGSFSATYNIAASKSLGVVQFAIQ